ncbi:hypothetical protein E1212_14315 [Jiangella ureilytica]|uniref:Uncharacterized protein n=1 Tax=Jiangella ureilytica TaxID=2530374 RepID=A0A4R4RM99_9ACTN|nr:hypothetical protein [Jiangella ureilytica]TDC50730.1 hypothetical protein E1212_14315 [Jiangella ureilytica]
MNEFDDLENTLAAELRRRSGDVLGTSGMADLARRRARVVRRRRAVAVSAVTAVALAIAVPTALSLRSVPQTAPPAESPTTSESPSPDPTTPPPSTPDPTIPPPTTPPSSPPADPSPPDETETNEPETPAVGGTTELVLDGMSEGAPPSISWVDGTTFHTADGREVTIPEDMYEPFAIYDGAMGWMPGSSQDGVPDIARVDGTGTLAGSHPGNGPVLSYDGFLMAEFRPSTNTIWAGQADGGGTGPSARDVPGDQRLEPVGFLDGYQLVSNVEGTDYSKLGSRIDSFAPGEPTPPITPPWDLVVVSAVSQPANLVVGYTEIRDDGTCSAVYEADSAEPLWETCEYSFDHFSPDGRLIVGTDNYRDGEGDIMTVVVDARTGEVVHTYEGRFINGYNFEDDEHLLINVRLIDGDERQAALVRCDFSGACELTTPVVRVDQFGDAYRLGLQRW